MHQLNTRLVIPDDVLALPVCGKRDNLELATWRQFAQRIGLAERAAQRVLRELAGALSGPQELIADASLPDAMRESYVHLVAERTRVLAQA